MYDTSVRTTFLYGMDTFSYPVDQRERMGYTTRIPYVLLHGGEMVSLLHA